MPSTLDGSIEARVAASRLGWITVPITSTMRWFAQICTLVMMILIFMDVTGRFLLGNPLRGAYVLNESYLMPTIVFMAMGSVYLRDDHVRIAFVVERLSPSVNRIVEITGQFAVVVVLLALTIATGRDAYGSWSRLETMLGAIQWPVYVARTIPPVGLASMTMVAAIDLVSRTQIIFGRGTAIAPDGSDTDEHADDVKPHTNDGGEDK